MKRTLLVGTSMLALMGLSMAATASDWDCFPLCAAPKPAAVANLKTTDVVPAASAESIHETAAITSCDSALMRAADELNDKVKPVRDVIGYVRSPQGLAIKLVNDHIVKIPAWIGYALDPLGSIKRQAMGEVRTRARDAMADENACAIAPAGDSPDVAGALDAIETVDAKHAI